MKITVCEIRNNQKELEQDWQRLVNHIRFEKSDLVLLPEMPFYPWVARTNQGDPDVWKMAVEAHDQWILRLSELSANVIVATRPAVKNGKRLNEGFVWEESSGYQAVHHKYYLPDEEGFWEATWYERGNYDFSVFQCRMAKIGFLICTELWFNEHARQYGKEGVHLLVCPRVTPKSSTDKWIAGGRTAAVVSGAFCLSSNLVGKNTDEIDFGGAGWIIEPEEGNVLGVTTPENPFLTVDLDLKIAEKAKHTYPRYVLS